MSGNRRLYYQRWSHDIQGLSVVGRGIDVSVASDSCGVFCYGLIHVMASDRFSWFQFTFF